MGDQEMEARGDGFAPSSYSVLAFPAKDTPENYRNFVLSKWMRTLRHGNDYFKLTDSDSFYSAYDKYLKHLLLRPDCVLRIAALSDDRDVALGFSVVEKDTLHYVYVQKEQRNRGIARSLVPKGITTISHLTKAGMSVWHNKLSHAVFDPFY